MEISFQYTGYRKLRIIRQHYILKGSMGEDLDTMTYMIAAEKMSNLLYTIEQTMQFMIEYRVKPDDEVKKALNPMVEEMMKWLG